MTSQVCTLLPARLCHFGIARTPFLSRFGAGAIRGAAIEWFGRANCRRVTHRHKRLISWRSSPAQGFQMVKRKPEHDALPNALGAPYARPRAARIVASKRAKMMSERRQSARRRTYLGARAGYQKPVSSDECLVRDRSPGGARIEFSGSTPFPDVFDLTIRDSGETRSVRVVWRDGLQAGVAYESVAFRSRAKPRDKSANLKRIAMRWRAVSPSPIRRCDEVGRRLRIRAALRLGAHRAAVGLRFPHCRRQRRRLCQPNQSLAGPRRTDARVRAWPVTRRPPPISVRRPS